MNIISRKEAKAQGLTRYFTGKPCKHGHVADRNTNSGLCMACGRDRAKKFRTENAEEHRARARAYYANNTEKAKATVKAYQQTEVGKANRARTNRAWWEANKAQHQATVRAWMQSNLGKCAAYASARRANIRQTDLSSAEREAINALYAERDRLNQEAGCIAYHVDHIQPLAKGGVHHQDNLQILTAEENLKKGAKVA